jgi:phospholipid/cholesterol/gamma-HCH transport system permease protein
MIKEIGKYFIFIGHLFINRESFKTYYKLVLEECVSIGIGSLFLVALVSTFMGAVTTVQTAYNMVSDFIPTMLSHRLFAK